MRILKLTLVLFLVFLLAGCVGNFNPNGPPPTNYPYFITTTPLTVKNIKVPIGTKLEYNEHFFKEGKQDRMLSEDKIHTLDFPESSPLIWGGVPVSMIHKFFNKEMTGYSVYADFEKTDSITSSRFAQLWRGCNESIAISVKDIKDWSFNKQNIVDVKNCGVLYQRYFINDTEQQEFLDKMLQELMLVDVE